MVWIGILIVIVTFAAIIKGYETRLVLAIGGISMALIAGNFQMASIAFDKTITNPGLVIVTTTVMGFAYVLKATECDTHMIRLATKYIGRIRQLLIPFAIVITFIANSAMASSAGTAAAVGIILIPLLINSGVHPVMAGAAVLAGTWGNVFALGSPHPPIIAKLSDTDVITVFIKQAPTALTCLAICVILITLTAIVLKENKGYIPDKEMYLSEDFSISYARALVPFVPVTLLIASSKQIALLPTIRTSEAMIAGCVLAFLASRTSPSKLSKEFFDGMGYGLSNIVGLMITSSMFSAGLSAIGITTALTAIMKESVSIAKIGATFGPFIIAIISGSGDAATLAFNTSVTPHAAEFGFDPSLMGSLSYLTGSFGRTMSPVAGVTIICASLTGNSNPIELIKRTALTMFVLAIVAMFMLL